MEKMLVSPSPQIRDNISTSKVMTHVLVALCPALAMSAYVFGGRALMLTGFCMITALIWERLCNLIMKRPDSTKDVSALVTGMLLAFNLPVTMPYWQAAIGTFVAIVIVKQLFGGLGQNFMNPALSGRCFLLISFAGKMTDFSVSDSFKGAVDGVTGATPLAALRDHGFVAGSSVPIKNLLIGNIQGTIGETSVIAILIGAAILLCYKVISARIPLTYIGSFAVFVIIYMLASGKGFDVNYLFTHLFGGGLMLGAWFMATDYVTSPITVKGQYVYGVCLGVLTGIFRIFGASAEGVSYAIIFCNLLVPQIERFTRPVAFGKGGAKK